MGVPYNNSFLYPVTAGYSYSFTEDGYYEEASFTWISNATNHFCVQANIIWQHGTYAVNPNGSITTDSTMFAGDGRIQVQVSLNSKLVAATLLIFSRLQNACASTSSEIYYHQVNNLFPTWAVSDWRGREMLRLSNHNGLMPRMFKVSNTPRDYMFESMYLS